MRAPFQGYVESTVKPPMDPEEVRRLYVEDGLSSGEIGRRLGYHEGSVRQLLRRHGVPPRPRPARARDEWGEDLYRVWVGMRDKCRRPGSTSYPTHGGRGIDIVPEWESFVEFALWAKQAGYRPGLRLVLLDRDRDFSPRTCAFVTPAEERELRDLLSPPPPRLTIAAYGETKTLAEWAADRRCVVTKMGLRKRLEYGYSPEDAITATRKELASRRKRTPLVPRTRILPRIDVEQIATLHVDEGLSPAEVAKRLGLTYAQVHRALRRTGTLRRQMPAARPTREERLLYNRWKRMWRVRTDPHHRDHARQGGVKICKAWREFAPFREWAFGAGFDPELYLVRIDPARGFAPDNCEWVTMAESIRRKRPPPRPTQPRTSWRVTAFGETRSLSAWSEDPRCQVTAGVLARRMRGGMSPEQAITTPRMKAGTHTRTRVTAFGETKGVTDWARDPRCRVTIGTLFQRLSRGVPPEEAIRTPAWGDRRRLAGLTASARR